MRSLSVSVLAEPFCWKVSSSLQRLSDILLWSGKALPDRAHVQVSPSVQTFSDEGSHLEPALIEKDPTQRLSMPSSELKQTPTRRSLLMATARTGGSWISRGSNSASVILLGPSVFYGEPTCRHTGCSSDMCPHSNDFM